MRIVIDVQGMQTESKFRGIGRYVKSFVMAMVRNKGEHEVFLVLNGILSSTIASIRSEFEGVLPQENIRVWYAPNNVAYCNGSGNITRRLNAEIIRDSFIASMKPDVVHVMSLFEGYGEEAVTTQREGLNSWLTTVMIYDLIPLLNPEEYLNPNPSYEKFYRHKLESLERFDAFLAISEFSRREAIDALQLDELKITSISTAVEPIFRKLNIEYSNIENWLLGIGIYKKFILYTGGADRRKNLPRLIQAFAHISIEIRSQYQLVLAGKMSKRDEDYLTEIARSFGLSNEDIFFAGYVTDEELVKLYNVTALYVFPSWHEGFGLPAVEAMACGAPVIGANTSSLPEVIGLDEALFDPFDFNSIANKIELSLTNEVFRNRLSENGLRRAKSFSWDFTANKAISVFESLYELKQNEIRKSATACEKPILAFVSPLPPERTGIAGYSLDLLNELSKHYDIYLVVDQISVVGVKNELLSKVRDSKWLLENSKNISRVLYQVGNSPFHEYMLRLLKDVPGVVVLHDFYLSGILSWMESSKHESSIWTQSLYDSHGYIAVRDRFLNSKSAVANYPVNLPFIKYATDVIVHSRYSKTLAQQWYSVGNDWNYIPLVRSTDRMSNRDSARRALNIAENDFVVCSFGFIDATKLNHKLLNAWLDSKLSKISTSKLIFVGENEGGDYGKNLLNTVKDNAFDERIIITGFVSDDDYNKYLAAADIAVQLRTNSRGETSAAVLDCMKYGLPVIVNSNGSMGELDADAVYLMADKFDNEELVFALDSLWSDTERRASLGNRAKNIIEDQHSPAYCASRYIDVIESNCRYTKGLLPNVLNEISTQIDFDPSDAELAYLAESISNSFPLLIQRKRLFLDISALCRTELKTGIERVARALLLGLLESPPVGFVIEPVYLYEHGGSWVYRTASSYTLGLLDCPISVVPECAVSPENGDIVMCLDLSGDLLVRAELAGFFKDFRNRGVSVYAIVYDLLPLLMPDVFPLGAEDSHRKWIEAVSSFDGAFCISNTVADELSRWMSENVRGFSERNYSINWFHLGADVRSSAPSKGLPIEAAATIQKISARVSFLMVGTIEPRKGYLHTLKAFSLLWDQGYDVNLVIVGQEGWRGLPNSLKRDIPEILDYIQNHPEFNKRLFWLKNTSDEYLEKVYAISSCLIAASYGEGFGLPLIEAAQYRVPIIARNIKVFREVAGDNAYYFVNNDSFRDLAGSIIDWLELYSRNQIPKPEDMTWLTWKESSHKLANLIHGSKLVKLLE
tara:strand:+ start:4049 stop:7822 length:3774 start_codon:yes stop_codon:yes gene_type:complete